MSAWRLSLSAAALVLAACGGGDAADRDVGPPTDTMGRSGGPEPAATVVRPGPGETLAAKVTEPVALRASPAAGARVVARAGRRTEFSSATTMAVMKQRGRWLGVVHESLANGRIGWVRADRVRILREPWRIDVDLSDRRATLRRGGEVVRRFAVAIGAPGTATPTGRYGVTDRLTTGGPGSPYGCCVLALSGHQPDVPQDWPGGDRLAIHGTSAPSSIGQAASHGCLRASERTMRLLLAKVPLGARVTVRP